MERIPWKITSGNYTMEVASCNLRHGSYLMELTPWKLPSGTYNMEAISWNLHHGSYV